jgi:uncharacterized Zn finger protein
MSWGYYGFRPYVSAGERRHKAQRETAKLGKKGQAIHPIQIEGRAIARTFWGKAWCENLEAYSDFANRLPRGRTYVRNGSVVHLEIRSGEVEALVSGSELYKVKIKLTAAIQAKWKSLCQECAGGIGSLIELLQGRFSESVMAILTRKETGLFPSPKEIEMKCSCPDWATMCKHVAAVLYGVGARLDKSPELLFLLRSVNHEDLLAQAGGASDLTARAGTGEPGLAESELSSVFGIELDNTRIGEASGITPVKMDFTPRSKIRRSKPQRAKTSPKKTRRSAAGRAGKTKGKQAVARNPKLPK